MTTSLYLRETNGLWWRVASSGRPTVYVMTMIVVLGGSVWSAVDLLFDGLNLFIYFVCIFNVCLFKIT